ncbi:hypothetical protein [Paenibacillus cremeus]|uniref:Sporulation protein n=1 Tax=Paenibacillus cremeus TaxID=2163881 RepID=A0A559KFE2_9BACL|nr:hypothetical protein [Paenibacillus cremeus]TVY10845.1 hypothetical protein FPZ49_07050 [Paenibacillus cremeus]
MSRWMSIAIAATLLLSVATACQAKDTHHEVQTHSKDGLLGITEVNPNMPLGGTYRTYQDDVRVMDQAIKDQVPSARAVTISHNGPTVNVRLDVPIGTTREQIEQYRAKAQEALAAAVPRYNYKVSVAVK